MRLQVETPLEVSCFGMRLPFCQHSVAAFEQHFNRARCQCSTDLRMFIPNEFQCRSELRAEIYSTLFRLNLEFTQGWNGATSGVSELKHPILW